MATIASRRSVKGECPFCGRSLPLTFHHLIPKKMHRRKRFKRLYERADLARGIYLCRDCHDGIHTAYSERELAERLARHMHTREQHAPVGCPRIDTAFEHRDVVVAEAGEALGGLFCEPFSRIAQHHAHRAARHQGRQAELETAER